MVTRNLAVSTTQFEKFQRRGGSCGQLGSPFIPPVIIFPSLLVFPLLYLFIFLFLLFLLLLVLRTLLFVLLVLLSLFFDTSMDETLNKYII